MYSFRLAALAACREGLGTGGRCQRGGCQRGYVLSGSTFRLALQSL